jgi:hypothetical protein
MRLVIARSEATKQSSAVMWLLDRFASLAMTDQGWSIYDHWKRPRARFRWSTTTRKAPVNFRDFRLALSPLKGSNAAAAARKKYRGGGLKPLGSNKKEQESRCRRSVRRIFRTHF